MDTLLNFLYSLNISKSIALDYVGGLKSIRVKKKEHFQMQGISSKYMGYVTDGKFRYYKIDAEGNERTLWLNKSFPFVGDYHSFLQKTNAELSIQALGDYDILLFTYDKTMELFDMNVDTQKFRSTLAERSMFGWRNIALSLHFDTAEERYLKLVSEYPAIEKEIPLKYIASCLGISPETLSRIRRKYEKNTQP